VIGGFFGGVHTCSILLFKEIIQTRDSLLFNGGHEKCNLFGEKTKVMKLVPRML
jgi:hypothetical protein